MRKGAVVKGERERLVGNDEGVKYNEQGNRTEVNFYASDGEPAGHQVYKYDAQGNNTERIQYDAEGAPKRKWTLIR